MANLKLTLACWDYDRTRALFDGRVRLEGIDLELWSTLNVGEIMERMVRHRQFEVSELGITYYLRSLELAEPALYRHSGISQPLLPPFLDLRECDQGNPVPARSRRPPGRRIACATVMTPASGPRAR